MLNFIYTLGKLGTITTFYSLYSSYKGRNGNSDLYLKSAYKWAEKVIKLLKINLKISGKELLNADSNYVYISNHLSLIDIPVLTYGLNDNIRIIYKKELEKIPLFGLGMKYSPFIPVSRDGGADAKKTLASAIDAIKENKSILVFAEGTRSKDGSLGEFKRGAFLLAEKSGKQIVPVTIKGTNLVLPKGKYNYKKGVTVEIIISAPMDLPEVKNKKTMADFIQEVRDTIYQNTLK